MSEVPWFMKVWEMVIVSYLPLGYTKRLFLDVGP